MKIDKISGSRVTFDVVISSDVFEKGLDYAFSKKKDEVEVKGFRKGHLPREIYEQKFGVESLYEEALNYAINETYFDAIQENEINVCAHPHIDIDPEKIKRGSEIVYNVKVAVFPEIELGEYKGLEVNKDKVVVSDAEVEEDIKAALEKNAMMVVKEDGVLEDGDQAIFDFEGFKDGVPFEGGKAENYELVIGSGQFIPGFEEQMIGMKPGEEKDINLTFPEQYHSKDLAGQPVVFKIKLNDIKVKELAELNDEFVKEQEIENVNTVSEYRAHVKAHILSHKEEHADFDAKEALYDLIISAAKFELPEDLINEEAKYYEENATRQATQYGIDLETFLKYTGGKSVEEFKEDMKKQAVKSLGFKFVLKKIGEVEKLEVLQDEVTAKYNELAEQYKVGIEQVKAAIPNHAVEEELLVGKALEFVQTNNKFIVK